LLVMALASAASVCHCHWLQPCLVICSQPQWSPLRDSNLGNGDKF
jgi:hypothetical protein